MLLHGVHNSFVIWIDVCLDCLGGGTSGIAQHLAHASTRVSPGTACGTICGVGTAAYDFLVLGGYLEHQNGSFYFPISLSTVISKYIIGTSQIDN